MPERVLSLRELNRATLARQHLLRRSRLRVPRAVEAVGALQAQLPASPYLALWARLDGFRMQSLARALERRAIVKATLMRRTLHLVSAADYLSYAGLFTRLRADEVERQLGGRDLGERALLAEELATSPVSRSELLELLAERRLSPDDRHAWLAWHGVQARASLLLAPESAAWRLTPERARFVAASAWLGRRGADGPEAVARVVRRYLRAFGPASVADARQWTGLPAATLREAVELIGARRFVDADGRMLLDLPRAPLPDAGTPAPARLLPMWDSVLLAHDDRRRVLADEHRSTVIARNGDVARTILVDGVVAGTWSLAGSTRVVLEPFAPLPRAARREVEAEARSLEAFLAATAAV